MKIKLRVFPLEDCTQAIATQKCILPAQHLKSKYRSGSWVKCGLQSLNSGKEFNVVSQVYPQDEHAQSDRTFLDAPVVDGAATEDDFSNQFQNSMLKSIETLTKAEAIDKVELTFYLNMEFFTKFKRVPSLRAMANICKELLQGFCLTKLCTVRSPMLNGNGIAAIVTHAEACGENCYYSLTDETDITVTDVRFQSHLPNTNPFYTAGFEAPIQDLNNLLEQRNYKHSLVCLNALIVGASGTGKSALISHLARQRNVNYFKVSMEHVLGQYPGESEANLRTVFKAVRIFVETLLPQEPTILHIEDIDLLSPAHKMGNKENGNALRLSAQMCALLDSFNNGKIGVICLATTSDPKSLHKSLRAPGRFQREITIETPNDITREQLFELLYNKNFPQHKLNNEILSSIVRQTAGYVMSDLILLIRCIEQKALHTKSLDFTEVISEVLKKSKTSSLRGADVTVIKPATGFDSIGGMHTLKNHLKLSVLAGLSGAAAYKRFGLSLPKGILLYGPPGCAKTTIAKCLAAEAKMACIVASGADVYSPYVGSSEKFITKLFDTARKHAPCLIFLDEIDSLVGTRSIGSGGHNNDVQTRILSTLLTEMDGIVQTRTASEAHILVVAATNRPNMIDDALLRPGRFDQLIHVPAPDLESRRSILELLSTRMPFSSECDLSQIAELTTNYSGADICNLCNEAAMEAFQRDFNAEEIQKLDFQIVLERHKPSLTQDQIDSYTFFKKGRLR